MKAVVIVLFFFSNYIQQIMSTFNGDARNRYRKVLGYNGRVAPRNTTFLGLSNISQSYDIQQVTLHRDYYIIKDANGNAIIIIPVTYVVGEFEENYINFNWETQKQFTFTTSFSDNPIVTLAVQSSSIDNSGWENVNAYIITSSATTVTVGVSSIFTGSVKFKAINATSYPAIVENLPLMAGTYYTASAGKYFPTRGQTEFSVGFSTIVNSLTPSSSYVTPYDYYGTNNVDIYATSSVNNSNSISVTLSSEITNQLNFIVIKEPTS